MDPISLNIVPTIIAPQEDYFPDDLPPREPEFFGDDQAESTSAHSEFDIAKPTREQIQILEIMQKHFKDFKFCTDEVPETWNILAALNELKYQKKDLTMPIAELKDSIEIHYTRTTEGKQSYILGKLELSKHFQLFNNWNIERWKQKLAMDVKNMNYMACVATSRGIVLDEEMKLTRRYKMVVLEKL
eukprot:GHVP01016891.1.p1 GENE.GHVP01016891.1~~GHVP01016891.1.p1  ORF type:complete len:187 (-),score=38.67 GHVP01016891.1:278-838(-)